MKIKNSLSTYLEQAMVMTGNSLETIDKISDAVVSSEDSVKLVLTDPNDPKKSVEYTIPSLQYLKSEIDRLSASFNTMTNITDGAGSKVRLSDGSYRKIIASKVPSEAPTITSVKGITNFNFKSNWFFEDMLNPLLYVTWDMSSQISPDTEKVMIQRWILKCDTQAKIDTFNKDIKGRNDINYKEFLTFIKDNQIKYTLDDEIKDLPPRSRRYYGTFSVIRVETEKDSNGNNVRRYILDSLEFTDSRSGFENTRVLTPGDFVEVNTNPVTTRYEVIYVEASENKIGLKCIEGSEPIKIGADVLKISASQDTIVSVDVPVGYNERQVIFVKSIDPDSHMPSTRWSPGVGFYTNELTYKDNNGTTQTLQKFYQKNVVDFGQVLLSYATDYYPSIREGIKPNAPVLNYANGEGDFKIVQINTQLTETADDETFRSDISDKVRIQSELDNMADEIAKKKELIQSSQYANTDELMKAQSDLSTLINNQSIKVAEYNAVVNKIKARAESGNIVTPKYRVRGFWNIPDSKISPSSGEQKIIKFKIRYRYLSEYGNTNKEEEFTYKSGNVNVTGRFSNWNEIETKTRRRVKNENTGYWEWEKIDTADPDEVNINQLDIPINPDEQVEIQVKSVSEAGWPANPMESDWSEPITVAFSEFGELQADDVTELVAQNRVDAAVANVTKMFSESAAHMNTSFYTNDKYFAHTAESITSGFLSPEQTPITLYDKLQELQNQITEIIERINSEVGDITVNLYDDSDEHKVYTLTEGGTTYIYAGDYMSAVKNVTDQNGAIITKKYYIDISTDTQSGLFLLSKLTGNRLSMCPNTIISEGETVVDSVEDGNDYAMYDNVITPTTASGLYYKEQGRYDLVPINLTNSDMVDLQIASPSMYQSAQCRGQFIYSRFRNIGDTFDMYANCLENAESGTTTTTSNEEESTVPPTFKYNAKFVDGEKTYSYSSAASITQENILKEYNLLTGSNVPLNTTIPDGVYKIINRLPKTWTKAETAVGNILKDKKTVIRLSKSKGLDESTLKTVNKMNIRLSKLLSQEMPNTYTVIPKIQTAYGFTDLGKIYNDELGEIDEDTTFVTTHKIGYEDKDKYGKGPETCDSFLFLSPVSHTDIQVDGDTFDSSKKLKSGESLRVPVIYQYRMTDYEGKIFGTYENNTDPIIVNTKYANIIGIDIWTDRNAQRPKQYDIIVYSTYGTTTNTNTSTTKTSSQQTLINVGNKIAKNLNNLITSSKTVPKLKRNLKK